MNLLSKVINHILEKGESVDHKAFRELISKELDKMNLSEKRLLLGNKKDKSLQAFLSKD